MAPARRPGAPPLLTIEVSPAYELLLSIVVTFEEREPETRDLGDEWVADVLGRAGEDLVARIRRLTADGCDGLLHLSGLVHETPAPRTVAAFVDHLRQTDAQEILLHLVEFYAREIRRMTPPSVIRAAVAGDPEARAEFLRTSFPDWPAWNEYLQGLLDRDPEELKAELVEIIGLWDERVWRPESLTIMPILERDAESKRELMRELPLDRFVTTATNGVELSPRPGIERVVMIPTFVNRPVVVYSEVGDTLLIAYPVADESVSAETDAPPLRLVRLSKALGDEKRLRVLRALAGGEKTLVQLAEMFGIPKTTMHHHMIVLRTAGLVSATVGSKKYRLRHETVPDVGALLDGYLARPASADSTSTGTHG